MRKVFVSIVSLLLCLTLTACAASQQSSVIPEQSGETTAEEETASNEPATRTVMDGGFRNVTIPDKAERIAAMSGPSYEMVFMLDCADRIAMTKTGHTTDFPVALLLNPDLANYAGVGANPNTSVNVEDYLKNEVDLVLYYNNETELKKFESVGIPTVIAQYGNPEITTGEELLALSLDEYIKECTAGVGIIAEALGGDAPAEYEKWRTYYADTIKMLHERTKDIPDEDRPAIYWGNTWGENILATADALSHSYDAYLVGGKLYAPDSSGNFPEITQEQLFAWNPDIIIVDNHGNYPELVIQAMEKENSQWQSLSAVKEGKLYRVPTGVFFLDKGTTTPLLLLWMASFVQPDVFSDIDIIEEMKYYYKEFYEYDLSDEYAQKILDGWYEQTSLE